MPDSKKKIMRKYVKEAGFHSCDAADDTEDPVKRWIGREIKLFLHEENQHLPFFLGLASESIDGECDDSIAVEEDMDIDDDAFAEPSAD